MIRSTALAGWASHTLNQFGGVCGCAGCPRSAGRRSRAAGLCRRRRSPGFVAGCWAESARREEALARSRRISFRHLGEGSAGLDGEQPAAAAGAAPHSGRRARLAWPSRGGPGLYLRSSLVSVRVIVMTAGQGGACRMQCVERELHGSLPGRTGRFLGRTGSRYFLDLGGGEHSRIGVSPTGTRGLAGQWCRGAGACLCRRQE